jgi:hypothetical protein
MPLVPVTDDIPHNDAVNRSSRNPGAAERARAELDRDPARSNRLIAHAAQCDSTTVQRARKALEGSGQIPLTPVRAERPKPPPPSQTRIAIGQLGPSATPRQVADLAGVSIQAAWKALRQLRPTARDAACAVDSISVVKTCPRPSNRGQPYRLSPLVKPTPDLSRGLCATAPRGQRGWWTSTDPDERRAAQRACLSCPVLAACAEWSLSLPATDPAVYGGMLQDERLARRRRVMRDTG